METGITGIGSYAFAGLNSLENLRVSESVKSVGSNIFSGDSTQTVYFVGNKPEFAQSAFSGTEDITVYYPENNDTWNGIEQETFGCENIKWLQNTAETVSEIPEDIPEDEFIVEDNNIVKNETGNEEADFSSGDSESFDAENSETEIQEFDAPVAYEQDNAKNQGQSITFSRRVPYSRQIFVAVKNTSAKDILESTNLLYIKQRDANASGVVSFQYMYKENYTNPETKIYGDQIKDVNDLKITLASTVYVYSGYAIKPSANILDGNYVLKNGIDYMLSYSQNINAGKATVEITGKGKYTGKKKMYFTIKQANCNLQFKNTKVIKRYGSSAFTNLFKIKKTDGKITYLSSNPKVARVDKNSGKITITGLGKTVIKVQSKSGKNYKDGSANYVLTVIKGNNVIKASDIIRKRSAVTQHINIKASRRGGAKLSYKSNSRYVKVDSKGKITIAPRFTGKAEITISAAKTSKYNGASKKITVTVRK